MRKSAAIPPEAGFRLAFWGATTIRKPVLTARLAVTFGFAAALACAGGDALAATAKRQSKAAAAKAAPAKAAAPSAPPPSAAAVELAYWVITSGDNKSLPFAIVDKATAQVMVYSHDGELKGTAPALLGLASGDHSTPGVGDRELSDIEPEERTTPAGRFMAAYGPAVGGKTVLWVDYGTAISLHPVINTNPKEGRPKRLASATPEDNRITFGCINVSSRFYTKVVKPTFTGTEGVFYVLPEWTPIEIAFPGFRPSTGSMFAENTAPSPAEPFTGGDLPGLALR